MTKAQWISTIQHTLMGIDEQGRYRRPLIEMHIQAVYEQMYNEMYAQNKQLIHQYLNVFESAVVGDTALTSGFQLSEIDPISLPRKNGGIFRLEHETLGNLIMTDYRGLWAANNSDFDTVAFKGSYLVSVRKNADGYYMFGNGGTMPDGTLLYIYYIPTFTSLASTTEVLIPMGMEDHFIDRVIDTLQHVPPVDLINDNTIQ